MRGIDVALKVDRARGEAKAHAQRGGLPQRGGHMTSNMRTPILQNTDARWQGTIVVQ